MGRDGLGWGWMGYQKCSSILLIIFEYIDRVYEPARHGPVHAVFFYYMSNRVEHQKLNHEAAELPPG